MLGLLSRLLLFLPPEEAHAIGLAALSQASALPLVLHALRAAYPVPEGGALERMGLRFRSRVGLAGGFDKNAQAAPALGAIGFGFLELGTVTAEAQEPNPPPNLFRLSDDRALVNRLGFPNEGAAAVAARFAASPPTGVPVGLSIGKSRSVPVAAQERVLDDYRASFAAVRKVADFVVVNVSSPNTTDLRALQAKDHIRPLLEALCAANADGESVPLLVKVSPDLSPDGLDALFDVVRDLGVDGVVATNTTTAREGLRTRPSVVLEAGRGGLSGPPLRARALEVVRHARARLGGDATIVGVGGIETGAHARAYLEAGADLVQIYTGFVYGGPGVPSRIARELLR